jgi:hypothetical protein
VTNNENLISDSELSKILSSEIDGGAHRLPFGDVLLEYLKLLKEALFSHVHNGNGNTATDLTSSGNKQALTEFKAKAEKLEKKCYLIISGLIKMISKFFILLRYL